MYIWILVLRLSTCQLLLLRGEKKGLKVMTSILELSCFQKVCISLILLAHVLFCLRLVYILNFPSFFFFFSPGKTSDLRTTPKHNQSFGFDLDQNNSSFSNASGAFPLSRGHQEDNGGLPSISLLDGVNTSGSHRHTPLTSTPKAREDRGTPGLDSSLFGPSNTSQGIGGGNNNPDDCWVTIFGFSASQTSVVIDEFLSCGQIISHHTDNIHSNWVHVQFETVFGAQRALTKDGAVLDRNGMMVGVRRYRPSKESSKRIVATPVSSKPTLQPLYLRQQRAKFSVTTPENGVFEASPYVKNSCWQRFLYYVFGL